MSEHKVRQIALTDNRTEERKSGACTCDHMSKSDSMAAYTEIAYRSQYGNYKECAVGNYYGTSSEDALMYETEGLCKNRDVSSDKSENGHERKPAKRPATLYDKSSPFDLGTVRKEGEMTHFVAENLEYKIKLSSPISKREINTSSKTSTPSTSVGILPRHFLQPHMVQIDSNALSDIEIDAQYLAASVDNLTENLYNLLHSVSSITADNVEIHKNSVNKLTDNMDANIKCMYTIMAKTEEISKSMKPTEQLALRIREIKRLVDIMDNSL